MSPSGPERVRSAAVALGLDLEVRELAESTRTAAEAARAVGCPLGAIAKSLVFRGLGSNRAILSVVSGANRVDLEKLATLASEGVGKANADFVRAETGYAIGGVPPFGHPAKLPTFLDRDLQNFDSIWAAAGSPFALFEIAPDLLRTVTGAKWMDLAE